MGEKNDEIAAIAKIELIKSGILKKLIKSGILKN